MVMVLRIGRVRVRVGVSLTFCVPPRQVVTSLESLHSSASPTPTAPVGLVVALQPGFGSVGSIAAKQQLLLRMTAHTVLSPESGSKFVVVLGQQVPLRSVSCTSRLHSNHRSSLTCDYVLTGG